MNAPALPTLPSLHALRGAPVNAALTVALSLGLAAFIWRAFDWAVLSATLTGTSREACDGQGACWTFVKVRLGQFMFGFFPEAERWRVGLAFTVLLAAAMPAIRGTSSVTRFACPIIGCAAAVAVLHGGFAGLVPVPTHQWGGLMLNALLALAAGVAALPFAVAIALARLSTLPWLRSIALAHVELWRGVPIIAVLFMAGVIVPLLAPPWFDVDKLLRAFLALFIATSAFQSEVIRAALQAVPSGQWESAFALGLGRRRTYFLVVLPQAMRTAIPGLVNELVTLWKNTSLVIVVGVFDLLGVVQAAVNDAQWLGLNLEGYVFAGAVFFSILLGLSSLSRILERRLNGAGSNRR